MLGLSRGVRRGALKYHVVSAGGIHANSAAAGGGTGTSASPFNTLAAAHTAVSAGGTIRLARGSVFRENFTITKANVTVEPYGSGADPIISGGTVPGSWTLATGDPLYTNNDVWYTTGVTVEPMLVTFNGVRGARRFYKTAMNSPGTILNSFTNYGEFFWDHRTSRLYVCSATNPSTAWTTVEMAQRVGPVRVQAAGVTLNTIKISHHNLDDRTNGIVQTGQTPTLSGITTQHSGDDVADYHNIRYGRNDSPFNTRLSAANTTVAAQSGLNALGIGFMDWSNIGHRTVIATGSDPLFSAYYSTQAYSQISNGQWARHGNSLAIENEAFANSTATWPNPRFIFSTAGTSGTNTPGVFNDSHIEPTDPLYDPYPNPSPGPFQFRCPLGVQPPPDWDGHVAVFQPDGSCVEFYSPIVLSQGANANKIVAFSFSVTELYGKLDARRPGMTASRIANYATVAPFGAYTGVNRSVPHALGVYMPEAYMARAAVYPALTWDSGNAYSGTNPMGTRWCLPQNTDLTTNTWWSVEGFRFAQAALDYGVFMVDRGGGGMTFKCHMGSEVSVYTAGLWSDMDWVRARLVRVTG